MKFAKWLYNLSNTDQYILIGFFIASLGLSYLTIIIFRTWHLKIHGSNKFAHEMRVTPFGLVGVALLYSVILYMSIGETVTKWVIGITQ
ncbi:MAG: hypothetical protein OXR70_07055 [Candidatus Marinimicrobia bacterium]|nr:hypothetical protein [Candidatus Neomarinimicrobiota bacterium]MDD9931609.1 hypothetical protein [Candidatus Neomarinimicrobiota bacterium]